MSDRYTLQLKNFRSIRDAEIDIAPLTVVYGPNGAGKSSLIYGLLTLKNFLTDPNRNLPSLFLYPGIGLGGYKDVVFNHGEETISASLAVHSSDLGTSKYTLGIENSGGKSSIYVDGRYMRGAINIDLDIPFPYGVNQYESKEVYLMEGVHERTLIRFAWNGVNMNFMEMDGKSITNADLIALINHANSSDQLARAVYFVPLRRGFTAPFYSLTNVTPWLATDQEVASILTVENYFDYKVSEYMEMVAGRHIRARTFIGTSSFTIDSIPRNGDTPVSIVNEGFGVNQLAYLLTIALYDRAKMVLIEEPEIHLHPSMTRKLVHAMVDIVSNHDRRFVISTHSEVFVVSLLSQIAAGKISVDDVSFILAEKGEGESEFTKQEAKSNGQIQGGLDSFIASEFEDIAAFLGLSSEEN